MGKHDKEISEREAHQPIYHRGRLTILLDEAHWKKLQQICEKRKKDASAIIAGYIETYELNPSWWGQDLNRKKP